MGFAASSGLGKRMIAWGSSMEGVGYLPPPQAQQACTAVRPFSLYVSKVSPVVPQPVPYPPDSVHHFFSLYSSHVWPPLSVQSRPLRNFLSLHPGFIVTVVVAWAIVVVVVVVVALGVVITIARPSGAAFCMELAVLK